MSVARSLFTSLGVILLGGALALQILYLYTESDVEQGGASKEEVTANTTYQYSAMAGNVLVLIYMLSYLIYIRPYSSGMAIIGWTIAMIGGTTAEFYLSVYDYKGSMLPLTYVVVVVNFLLRLYLFVDINCPAPISSIQHIIKETASAVSKPISETSKAVGKELESVDAVRVYQNISNKLGSVFSEAKTGDTQQREIKNQIRQALGLPIKDAQAPKVGGRRR
jgi:hypothetical protein